VRELETSGGQVFSEDHHLILEFRHGVLEFKNDQNQVVQALKGK
jgi:hypothetical protein